MKKIYTLTIGDFKDEVEAVNKPEARKTRAGDEEADGVEREN